MLNALKAQRAAIKAELEALVAGAEGESRSLNADESATFDVKIEELRKLDERIAELSEAEVREAAAAAHRVETAAPAAPVSTTVAFGDGVRSEPNPVYRKDNGMERSYFKDLFLVNTNGPGVNDARTRLVRSQETRAGDMASSSAATGGVFAPPDWLVSDYIAYARPARVTADLIGSRPLPGGYSTFNLPKVASGAATGVQATQNSALTDTAMTTTSVSTGITLIGGKQIIAKQLLDQSEIPFDEVILQDLAMDYAMQLDAGVLLGAGTSGALRGLNSASGANAITYTTTQPGVVSTTAGASFYNQIVKAASAVNTGRYLPPTAIVMRPDRWSWVLEALDSQNRPLVVPNGAAFNPVGTGDNTAQGAAGTLLGIPVYIDPNIPNTCNSATNQDQVFVFRTADVWLWETQTELTSFEATYADNYSVLFRATGYAAMIPDRYGAAVSLIKGTGLITATL